MLGVKQKLKNISPVTKITYRKHIVSIHKTSDQYYARFALNGELYQTQNYKKAQFLTKVVKDLIDDSLKSHNKNSKNPSASQIARCRKVLSAGESESERDKRIKSIPFGRAMENPTIRKHFKTIKEVERFQNQLYNKYDVVQLESSPMFSESGTYVFYVDSLISEREKKQKIKRNSSRSEVRSPTSTRTEVRSPTSTETDAYTSGNVTVTGGAGAGANTTVKIYKRNPKNMYYYEIYVSGDYSIFFKSAKNLQSPSAIIKHAERQRLFENARDSQDVSYAIQISKADYQATQNPNKKPNFTNADFRKHQTETVKANSEMFQGKVSGERVKVMTANGTPKTLSRLGDLKQMIVKLPNGTKTAIKFDGDAFLAMDTRKNLHCVGKDARLGNVRVIGNGLAKLGDLVQIDYQTAKAHIGNGKETYYYHKLGEVTGEKPKLMIDKQKFLHIINGNYDVWSDGIVN